MDRLSVSPALLWYCWLFGLCCGIVTGITLSPCGNDNTAEVIEGETDNTFTCTGLASRQQWDWTLTYNSQEFSCASCPGNPPGSYCTRGDMGAVFTASRVSNTESRVVINSTALIRKEFIQYGTLKCNDNSNSASCQMDYIVPVQGNCTIQPGTGSSRFNLDGKCTLEAGAKSSRNRFKCVWTRKGGSSWQHSVPLAENTYQTGCVLTRELPTDAGQYTYDVQLFPGRRTVTAGTIQITKPEAPTVSGCGGGNYIPENTTVTCTCNTNGIGQPAGRLQWVKVNDSSILKEGNYGEKSFTVSQTLLRADHQSTEFWCNVQWIADIPGTPIKFNVGYPPTEVFLRINQVQSDQTVSEHQSVDFSCQNSNGRPDPTLSLAKRDNSTVLFSRTSYLNHVVVSRCEDSGEYTCTADNGMGPVLTGTPASLFVRCSPRGHSDLGEVNFNSDPVSVSFTVTAYPVPSQVTFSYLGTSGNTKGVLGIKDTLIQLTGRCQPTPGAVHLSTCTVTVIKVSTETARGFYQVTVTNTQGSGQFRLQISYTGQEAPTTVTSSTSPGVERDSPSPSYLALAVGAYVALGVVLIVDVIFVIWLWRRQWILPCADMGNHADSSARPETAPDDYLEPVSHPADNTGPYDSLQMADVGQRSVYSDISALGHPAPAKGTPLQQEEIYENTSTAKHGRSNKYGLQKESA